MPSSNFRQFDLLVLLMLLDRPFLAMKDRKTNRLAHFTVHPTPKRSSPECGKICVVSATTAGSSEGVYAEALLHENNMQRLYPVDKQVLGS